MATLVKAMKRGIVYWAIFDLNNQTVVAVYETKDWAIGKAQRMNDIAGDARYVVRDRLAGEI